MLKNKRILLGVTGGIAAYKSVYLCRLLKARGADVRVVMTKNAREFVAPLTFRTVSENQVACEMFDSPSNVDVRHVSWAQTADALVIAPATANIIAKAACGIADDFLSTLILAVRAPKIIAPAMNDAMWDNPATRRNMETLKGFGFHSIGPETGSLACGTQGEGRMVPPEAIADEVEFILTPKDLEREKILVTAGPTIEPIDPVRFISNRSSGKMGYAIAQAAARRGAQTTLISGPTNLPAPPRTTVIQVSTAEEMRNQVLAKAPSCSVVVKTAAVCDWKPSETAPEKIKKSSGSAPTALKLEKNPDILAELGAMKRPGQMLVGFAAETENLLQNAKKKFTKKNLDMIVANDVTAKGCGFGSDENAVVIVTANREIKVELAPKAVVADKILDVVLELRKKFKQ